MPTPPALLPTAVDNGEGPVIAYRTGLTSATLRAAQGTESRRIAATVRARPA